MPKWHNLNSTMYNENIVPPSNYMTIWHNNYFFTSLYDNKSHNHIFFIFILTIIIAHLTLKN